MSDAGQPGPGDAPAGADPGATARIAALHDAGAQRLDPLRFAYLEALARRTAAQSGALRRLLDHKLALALAACSASLASAPPGVRAPAARLDARLETLARRGPLGELVHDIDRQALPPHGAGSAHSAASPGQPAPAELKALSQFKSTWRRLSAERQLTQSLAQAPDNPGPLNSHRLLLRALRLMQDISPAYLDHFMAHVETLLWLDQAGAGRAAAPTKAARREGDKKRKAGRSPGR